MSLDMANFDLFSKNKQNIIQKPIVAALKIEEKEKEIEPIQGKVEMKREEVVPVFHEIKANEQVQIIEANKSPKYETFLPVTARILEAHALELKKIENTIMRNRKKAPSSDRERITVNTVMRCLISNFLERAGDLDLTNIDNETELNERLEKVFKHKKAKSSQVG